MTALDLLPDEDLIARCRARESAAWAVLVEVMSWPCPLTPLENHFRRRAGRGGYEGGFVEHYLIPVIYPSGLTDEIQFLIGAFVFTVNAVVYSFVVARWVRTKREPEQEAAAEVAFVRD